MEEDGCRETVIREMVEDKESEGEGRPGREEGRYKILSMFKGRDGGGEISRETDKERQTTNLFTLIAHQNDKGLQRHHLLLCLSFICLLKSTRKGLNNNYNGILCVSVCV